MQNWPRGPSSLHELFLWPETYAKKLLDLPGATENAQALMQYEFLLNDAYSGMGTGSYAFHLAAKHTARTYGITNRFSFFIHAKSNKLFDTTWGALVGHCCCHPGTLQCPAPKVRTATTCDINPQCRTALLSLAQDTL